MGFRPTGSASREQPDPAARHADTPRTGVAERSLPYSNGRLAYREGELAYLEGRLA
jgi:hypothetical protein